MILDIREDMKEVNKLFRSLASGVVPNAISSAINKTLTTVRAEAAREIKSEVSIKIKQIKTSIRVRKSSPKNLSGHYIVIPAKSGRGMNLIEFVSSAKRNTKAFRKGQGVIAKAWEKNKLYKGAFIARGKSSGKLLVFKKDKRKASGVKALPAASIPAAYFRKKVLAKLDKIGRVTFEKNLQREIAFRVKKLK